MADPVQPVQSAAPIQMQVPMSSEGGGLPVHASQFQVIVDTSEVTLIFLQKLVAYSPTALTPTITHRVIGQVSLSHMLAKDLNKQLGNALKNFERQFPIPEIIPLAALNTPPKR